MFITIFPCVCAYVCLHTNFSVAIELPFCQCTIRSMYKLQSKGQAIKRKRKTKQTNKRNQENNRGKARVEWTFSRNYLELLNLKNFKCEMSTATGIFVVSLFVQSTILWSYVGFVSASPCSRVPQGTGAGKSVPSGNFGIRISSASTFYQPGRDYTSNRFAKIAHSNLDLNSILLFYDCELVFISISL